MDIVYFLLLCIVIVVVWRYITKRFFSQGKGGLLTYFVASSMAFCIFSFGIVVIATHDTNEPKVHNEVSKEKNFKEDQVALTSYFNKIIPVKLYVDLQAEEMVIYLQQNDIIKAASSTKKCTETTKTFSKELERGDYKAIPLKDIEHNKALKTAIEKLALGYSYRNAQCAAAYKYLDDPKPSTAVEIKEQKTLADSTISLAMDSLKKEIMKNYYIELLNNGEYAVVE